MDTANRLAELGERVTFIPTSDWPRPDVELSSGGRWEIKSPAGGNRNTILTKIRDAADRGKRNFILDLARTPMSIDAAKDLARYAVDNYPGVTAIRLIGRDTPEGPLDVTIRNGGE
ncbi:hypothetical protein ACAG26_01640 [Mycobacterium sp. pUA109]|uniref:CdiA C-terminal domain-containing protein n=1 Tax=Mycobacterium sp. pUA109 TaxID=3238982 RepID=UPI00351BDBDE